MSIPSPTVHAVLWRLIGPTGHVSECELWELPSGQFQIRLVHDREPEATERYATSTEATERAATLATAFIQRGWRDAGLLGV